MIAEIQFECSQCGRKLAVDAAAAGLRAACPFCHASLVVPGDTLHADLGLVVGDGDHPAPELEASEVDGLREKWAETSTAIARLKRDLAEAQAAAAQTREELEALTTERDSLASAAALLQAQVERSASAKLVYEEELALNRRRLSATDAQLSSRERDLAAAQAAVAGGEAEVHTAQQVNDELIAEGARLHRELEAALQSAHAAARDLDAAHGRLAEVEPRLALAEEARDALAQARAQLEGEVASLRRDLLSTAEGRELVDLRARIKTSEQKRGLAERMREQSEEEMARLAASEARQRGDVEALLRRCETAERRAEAVSDPQLHTDNEVLRGIVNRQKDQLQQKYIEIGSFQRARFGGRFLSFLFGVSVAGGVWYGLKTFPNILPTALQALRELGF